MKLTTFFVLRNKQTYSKTLTFCETVFKIKAMSAWILQTFAYVSSYLQIKKKRLCNIFKTTNTKTLAEAISEINNKLLQTP